MSYILDSLKKLEQEKAVLENNINLKELVVQDVSNVSKIKLTIRRNYLLILLASSFSFLFLQSYSRYSYRSIKVSPSKENSTFGEKKTSKDAQIPTNRNQSTKFPIPQEFSKDNEAPKNLNSPPTIKTKPISSTNYLKDPEENNKMASTESPIKPKTNSDTEFSLYPQNLANIEDELDQRIDHNEELVQEKYSPQTLKKLTGREKSSQALPRDIISKPIGERILDERVQDLKIKGIVFFGADNPLNYILANYKEGVQLKLKAGDRLYDMQILDILADKIILDYHNKIFEKGLGS